METAKIQDSGQVFFVTKPVQTRNCHRKYIEHHFIEKRNHTKNVKQYDTLNIILIYVINFYFTGCSIWRCSTSNRCNLENSKMCLKTWRLVKIKHHSFINYLNGIHYNCDPFSVDMLCNFKSMNVQHTKT